MFGRKKKYLIYGTPKNDTDLCIFDIPFPSGAPVICGGYNIYTVFYALKSFEELCSQYERYSKRRYKEIEPVRIKARQILHELAPYIGRITRECGGIDCDAANAACPLVSDQKKSRSAVYTHNTSNR